MSDADRQSADLTDEPGHPTPEAPAVVGYPPQSVKALGSRIDGDRAIVWLLTNDRPPFDPYTEDCVRARTRRFARGGELGPRVRAMRRLFIVVVALLLPAVGEATAAPTTISEVSGVGTVSASPQRVVWSESRGDAWVLFESVGAGPGRPVPNVAQRSAPFDVDLGTDDNAREVATYSRCEHDSSFVAPFSIGTTLLTTATGCRAYEYDFADAAEHPLHLESSRDSVYLPTRWGTKIAYVRRAADRSVFTSPPALQLVIRDVETNSASAVRGGPQPGADTSLAIGPTQMDLRGSSLAFNWVWPLDLGRTCPRQDSRLKPSSAVAFQKSQIVLVSALGRRRQIVDRGCSGQTRNAWVQGATLQNGAVIYGRNGISDPATLATTGRVVRYANHRHVVSKDPLGRVLSTGAQNGHALALTSNGLLTIGLAN